MLIGPKFWNSALAFWYRVSIACRYVVDLGVRETWCMYSASIFSEAGVEAEGVGSLMLRNGMIVAAMRFIVCGEVLERMRRIR